MEGIGVFHNGESAKAFACKVVLNDTSICIYLDETNQGLIIWNITSIKTCQYNGKALLITYGNFPHQTLEVQNEFAQLLYSKWSGNKLIAGAEGFVFHKGIWAALILTTSFILLGLFTYFVVLPWAGETSASLIPLATEVELGNKIAERFTEDGAQDDSTNTWVNLIAAKLKLQSPYTIRISIIESETINAFAVPGGRIFIYSGIIQKMNSYEELVALMGHEMTHVVKQHSLKSICRSAAAGLFVATLFGDVTGISAGIVSQAQQFEELNYSRDLETEADSLGFQFMINNRVNPEGMLRLLELLKKEGAEMPGMMKYLSTHPDTDLRIQNINRQLKMSHKNEINAELNFLFKKIQSRLSAKQKGD